MSYIIAEVPRNQLYMQALIAAPIRAHPRKSLHFDAQSHTGRITRSKSLVPDFRNQANCVSRTPKTDGRIRGEDHKGVRDHSCRWALPINLRILTPSYPERICEVCDANLTQGESRAERLMVFRWFPLGRPGCLGQGDVAGPTLCCPCIRRRNCFQHPVKVRAVNAVGCGSWATPRTSRRSASTHHLAAGSCLTATAPEAKAPVVLLSLNKILFWYSGDL
jgi:hypothetical protein